MTDIATLRHDLEELRRARRTGAAQVHIRDRSVSYRSDGELARLIADIEGEIARAEGAAPQPRNIVVRVSKGW